MVPGGNTQSFPTTYLPPSTSKALDHKSGSEPDPEPKKRYGLGPRWDPHLGLQVELGGPADPLSKSAISQGDGLAWWWHVMSLY